MKEEILAFAERQQTNAAMEHCPEVEFFGAARRRLYFLENMERAYRGEPPLINDEEDDPTLTDIRRQRVVDCLAEHVYPDDPDCILPWKPD